MPAHLTLQHCARPLRWALDCSDRDQVQLILAMYMVPNGARSRISATGTTTCASNARSRAAADPAPGALCTALSARPLRDWARTACGCCAESFAQSAAAASTSSSASLGARMKAAERRVAHATSGARWAWLRCSTPLKSMADASSLRLPKPCATAPVEERGSRSSVRDDDEPFVAHVVYCV
jgi:hypothetical protein